MATRFLTATFGWALCALAASGCSNENPTGAGGSGGSVTGVGSTAVTASHSSSAATGPSTSSSGNGTGTGSTSSTSTGGPVCQYTDPNEPNDTIATAHLLPPITDCTSDSGVLQGVLGAPDDVDWFKYDGADNFGFGCVVDPTRQLTGQNIRICKYLTCTNAMVTCPTGTQFDTQGGKPGCCWTGGQSVTLDLNCNTTDDSATVFIKIDHVGGPGCEPYQVDYHF